MNTKESNEQWILTLREAIGDYTQKQFCQLAGLGEAQLSRLLNPAIASAPRPSTLRKIGDVSKTVSYERLMEAAGYFKGTTTDTERSQDTALLLASLLISLKTQSFTWAKRSAIAGALLSIELPDTEESWHFFAANDSLPILLGNLVLSDISATDRCFFVTSSEETFQVLTETTAKHLALPLFALLIDVVALQVRKEIKLSPRSQQLEYIFQV